MDTQEIHQEFTQPPVELMQQAQDAVDMDAKIARMVSEGIAAALPAVLAQIAAGQSSESQFPAGMGPSSQVTMSIAGSPSIPVKPGYLKHYRLDDAINGKHQLLDVKHIDANGDFKVKTRPDGKLDIPAILKGRYIQFIGGHFYATDPIEVAFIEWKIQNDPNCKIYEDVGGQVIPCPESNCGQFFGNEDGLKAHMRATHGIGR